MTKVRKADGSIVETVLQGSDGQPLPQPVTPAGGVAAGDNPDQAKMRGTPDQKAPILREAVKPQDTLAQAERLTPTAPGTPIDQQAKDKAGVLAKLGSYGSAMAARVADAMNTQVTGTPAPTVMENVEGIAQMFPDDKAKQKLVRDATAKYLKYKTPETMQALAVLLGPSFPMTPELMRKLTTDAQTALTTALTPGTQGVQSMTLDGLDLSSLGLGDDPWGVIARDLGTTAEALRAMTPDQFQQAVQDVVTREYSSTASLRAELKSASPNRKAQILQELRAADATGRAGVEASVADLWDRMESAETIKIGDDEYALKEIFSDDGMSKLVLNALDSDTAFKELETLSPALAKWITDNRATLTELAADISGQAQGFDTANTGAAELMGELGLADTPLAAAFGMPEGPMTPAQAKAWEESVRTNPLWVAAQADPTLLADLKDETKGPALITQLKGMTAGQIKTAIATIRALTAEHSPDEQAVLKLMGIDWADGLIEDPTEAKFARDTMAVLAQYPQVPAPELSKLLAGLKANNPAAFGRATTTAGLSRLMAGLDVLRQFPPNQSDSAAFRQFLGVGKDASYIDPGFKGPDGKPMDYAAAAKAFKDARAAMGAPGVGLQSEFFEAIAKDLVTTPADLAMLTEHPHLVKELLQQRQDSDTITQLTNRFDRGEYDSAQDGFAQALLGVPGNKKVTFKTLTDRLDDARGVLSRGGAWKNNNSKAVEQATAFLASLKKAGMDLDGDGTVTSRDFQFGGKKYPFGPNDEPTPEQLKAAGLDPAAVTKRLIANLRKAGMGDETHETAIAGQAAASTLPRDLWATYGSTDWSAVASGAGQGVLDKGQAEVDEATANTAAITETGRVWERTGQTKINEHKVSNGGKGGGTTMVRTQAEEVLKISYEDGHTAGGDTRWVTISDVKKPKPKTTAGRG